MTVFSFNMIQPLTCTSNDFIKVIMDVDTESDQSENTEDDINEVLFSTISVQTILDQAKELVEFSRANQLYPLISLQIQTPPPEFNS